jgi:hypothetical protein
MEESRAKTFSLSRSCGTPIIGPSASNQLSRLDRLGLEYLDLYLIHTPFAFKPGDEQDPRDANGDILYDHEVTLLDTWKAMESLVDHGKCRAIGVSDMIALLLVGSYRQSPVTTFAVDRKGRWNNTPRRRCLFHNLTCSIFQIADLVERHRLI